MKVHHRNCGTMRPPGGRLVDGRGGFLHRAELVCHCLLVETGSELVLIETGMGSPSVDRPDEWLGAKFVRLVGVRTSAAETAAEQVRRIGYAVEDVRHIVLTHLDLDHTGGLVDIPHATVHVYAEEPRALQSPRDAAERRRHKQVHFAHGPQWSSYADTGDGWLPHTGDAFFHHGQIDPVRPHATPGLAWFEARVETVLGARRENHRRLRELVRDHGDQITVLSAHDPWFPKHASRAS